MIVAVPIVESFVHGVCSLFVKDLLQQLINLLRLPNSFLDSS